MASAGRLWRVPVAGCTPSALAMSDCVPDRFGSPYGQRVARLFCCRSGIPAAACRALTPGITAVQLNPGVAGKGVAAGSAVQLEVSGGYQMPLQLDPCCLSPSEIKNHKEP